MCGAFFGMEDMEKIVSSLSEVAEEHSYATRQAKCHPTKQRLAENVRKDLKEKYNRKMVNIKQVP